MKNLEQIALDFRRKIVKMSHISGSGHITSAFSCLEILVTLYFNDILRYSVDNPNWRDRDYFILSKGHAAMTLFCVLSKIGFISETELWSFCLSGSRLGGHPTIKIPGVEASSGSLGHGLSIAAGIALGLKIDKKENTVFCLTGDGELQEGSIWEAALSIVHHKLNNLIWIIDKNNLQLADTTDNVISLGNLPEKMRAFGFDVVEINGHDFGEIDSALRSRIEKPIVIIANTIKGFGTPSIEGKLYWHGKKPTDTELTTILQELGMTRENLQIEKNI